MASVKPRTEKTNPQVRQKAHETPQAIIDSGRGGDFILVREADSFYDEQVRERGRGVDIRAPKPLVFDGPDSPAGSGPSMKKAGRTGVTPVSRDAATQASGLQPA